jgi:hypothetical protein
MGRQTLFETKSEKGRIRNSDHSLGLGFFKHEKGGKYSVPSAHLHPARHTFSEFSERINGESKGSLVNHQGALCSHLTNGRS